MCSFPAPATSPADLMKMGEDFIKSKGYTVGFRTYSADDVMVFSEEREPNRHQAAASFLAQPYEGMWHVTRWDGDLVKHDDEDWYDAFGDTK